MKKTVMTEGHLLKNILIFFVPIALANVLQILYNSCDLIVVGKFAGTTSLAAVGATHTIVNLLVNLFAGLSVGSSVTFSRLIGEKKPDEANKVVSVSFIISIVSGIILMIVGALFSRELLELMDTPEDCIDKATLYMQIYFLGSIFNILYNYFSAVVRAGGDSTTPLLILLFTGLVNVILNLIFVIFFNMDVAGVAVATILSQFLNCVIIIFIMIKDKGPIHFDFKHIKFDKSIFKEVIVLGVPSGVQSTLFSISNVIIQSTINSYGTAAVAGNSASNSIESFITTVSNALSNAIMTFVSQNNGARKSKYIKNTVLVGLLFGFILAIIFPGLIYLFAPQLLRIYTDDPEVIDYAIVRMTYHLLPFIIWVVVDTMRGAVLGLKKTTESMLIMLVGVCGIRLIWIFLIYPLAPSLMMVYISYPISWTLTAISLTLCFIISYKKLKIKYADNKNSVNITEQNF